MVAISYDARLVQQLSPLNRLVPRMVE